MSREGDNIEGFPNDVSEDELSDDLGLKIDVSTPKKKKKEIDSIEQKFFEEIEKGIEKTLKEKANASNLTEFKVKSIFKHVISNEAVLDLIKKVEQDEQVQLPYEPKLTRSKAKVLCNSSPVGLIIPEPIPTIPLTEPEPAPEVKALLTEDLREDSSGDEYVPGEEESDEENGTVRTLDDSKTSQLEEALLMIPEEQPMEDDATIALRTRSKFSLSSTPLEQIEESFVPPDLMSDEVIEDHPNNDTDCEVDKENWSTFLKSFSKPLEETFPDDEDQDPEYNILADDDIDNEVDKEELREDKAVKVSRRELNDLIAELFEYTDIYSMKTEAERLLDDEGTLDIMVSESIERNVQAVKLLNYDEPGVAVDEIIVDDSASGDVPITIFQGQLFLLQQQMRQHVQILTQNFLLTYSHPEFNAYSYMFKEYLLNLKLLSGEKEDSLFSAINLDTSLKLVNYWQSLFVDDIPEALETIKHFKSTMEEAIEKQKQDKFYHLPFPSLILQIISCCDVFVYPHLLPKIPYKHPDLLTRNVTDSFLASEDQLIALALDQFVPVYSQKKEYLIKKNLNMKKMATLVRDVVLPTRSAKSVYRRILNCKSSTSLPHPIAYYFCFKKAPYTLHYVAQLDTFKLEPPHKRAPKSLPLQWRNFIYPNWKQLSGDDRHEFFDPTPSVINNSLILCKLVNPRPPRPIVPQGEPDTVEPKPDKSKKTVNRLVKNVAVIEAVRRKYITHFVEPTPLLKLFRTIKKFVQTERLCHVLKCPCIEQPAMTEQTADNADYVEIKIEETELDDDLIDNKKLIKKDVVPEKEATTKCVRDKKDFVSDKKKAKIRKEYLSIRAMLNSPDPIEEKRNRDSFAQAYFEKLKETLDVDDYYRVVDVLKMTKSIADDAVDLYRKLESIIRPKYDDLADELLLFLNAEQANAVGRLMPFFIVNNMAEFLRKLDVHFRDQPAQVRKIYRSLTELDDSNDVTLDRIKTTILPMLKGNPLLCDSFLQIFLEEKPPATLLNGQDAWEFINVKKEVTEDSTAFETITVDEIDDSYGGQNCGCACHRTDEQHATKNHCIDCGLKFLQGRVYCQTPRGLKPVTVTFPDDKDVDHNARLGVSSRAKKNEASPAKRQPSPSKEHSDEQSKVTKKTKPKSRRQIFKEKESTSKESNKIKRPPIKRAASKINRKGAKGAEKCGSAPGQIKRTADNSPSSDSESSIGENPAKLLKRDVWTRDEDKVILETFRRKIDNNAVKAIAEKLKSRSVSDIKSRFRKLMSLLQEMDL